MDEIDKARAKRLRSDIKDCAKERKQILMEQRACRIELNQLKEKYA